MAKAKAQKETNEISIVDFTTKQATFYILGKSPMFYNAMSEKARQQLLMPAAKRKNSAERAATLKHNPIEEYRNSVYRSMIDRRGAAYLGFPSAAFKKATASAALDVPGAAKTEIGRLLWVKGHRVEVFGVPVMSMAIVRSADMARTPDVRTRAVLLEWCCEVTFEYLSPNLNGNTVAKLLSAAGLIRGIGDWRQEKGAGSFGQFEPVSEDNQEYARIVKEGGAEAQKAALAEPKFFDDETEKLYAWFCGEIEKRKETVTPSKKNGKATSESEAIA